MAGPVWSVHDAKKRFGKVVEAAQRKLQTVTKHGKPVVVIIATDEYDRLRKLQRLKTPSFARMLLEMPEGDTEFERLDATLDSNVFGRTSCRPDLDEYPIRRQTPGIHGLR